MARWVPIRLLFQTSVGIIVGQKMCRHCSSKYIITVVQIWHKLSTCSNSGYQAFSFPAHREPGYEARWWVAFTMCVEFTCKANLHHALIGCVVFISHIQVGMKGSRTILSSSQWRWWTSWSVRANLGWKLERGSTLTRKSELNPRKLFMHTANSGQFTKVYLGINL